MFYAEAGSMQRKAVWPSDITIRKQSRTIDLSWGDRNATISHHALRVSCRCADCESLRRAGHAFDEVPADIALENIVPVGEFGIQLFFSDGHDRGIFPWVYLHELAFRPAVEN